MITANLTRDPEMRTSAGEVPICGLRVACNSRVKRGDVWEDKPNYFDVTAFGKMGENCAKYLSKGRPVAVEGRLDWREWTTDDGQKRQAVQIIADNVQFLGDGKADSGSPTETGDFAPSDSAVAAVVAAEGADEDIPF